MGNQDAVDSLFSRFDNEEENIVDFSDSSPEAKVSESKVAEDTKPEEVRNNDSDKSDYTDSKEEQADENTPFHKHPRWQQKLANEKKLKEENKSMQERFDTMQKEIESLKSKPLTDEQLNNMTPQEIMDHTKKQLETEYNQKTELQKKEDEEADRYIEDSLEGLKDEWHDFDENKLLKYAEDFTGWDITKAFELYQMLNQAWEKWAEEEAKMTEKKKQAQSNSSNRWQTSKTSWYVRWTGWDNLDLK